MNLFASYSYYFQTLNRCKLFISFGLVSLFYQNVESQIPTNGLVAYYPFSGNVGDSSGNNYHGTTYNVTLVSDRFGNSNSAYKFAPKLVILIHTL